MNNRVVVGMSGGVDSSVTAYLLKKQGYEVIGVTMQVWPEDKEYEEREGGCCSLSSVEDARRVSDKLGIPFYVMNFRDIFDEKVIQPFVHEYLEGRTPNPCIACNKFIKFDAFLKKANALGADYIATGHYAKIYNDKGRFLIKNSEDDKKDQTYVLYNMTQYQLEHTLMPCGDYSKDRIREIAKEIGLSVHNKKDSEEICFIPDNDHGAYIKRQNPEVVKEGNFVDDNGNILGKHKGIVYYTIGQRKGLGIALGKPVFVKDINVVKNEVVLGSEEDIFKTQLIADNVNFIPFDKLNNAMKVKAKIRYASQATEATIYPNDNSKVKVVFKNGVRAITKGQSVVFYDDDLLLGGGIIEKIL
ncbi:tRNA 2-thiouridine(34) synthase MnmA [Clostridium sp.]|jgi:tRNA-specific 2-thiouridylase|uniref:tRNA 2-thiouridine(34) synthase MnmA n=1 Tax=Clostridium sp. TaxID=1506 RepID=UPI00258E9199|nr:tRNA 2-thiouridine(34) synthase MnmA [Clostridium sp.]MDF2505120.1 tRNA (5-methylaminomethyl-2-thiouridylate)-methyltransferase [Clostridium sp.]